MHILIIITTPTKPTAFFNIIPHPRTLSTTSPKIFPTTGTAELTIDFAVFAVIPSTLLASVPSKDTIPTKIVKIIPKNHNVLDFKNFDNFATWTWSDIFDIMLIDAIIKIIGINMFWIKFPIKFIKNNIIGSSILVVVMLPVYNISDTNTGINVFINPIRLFEVCFTKFITSEKLLIIIVTIAMYCT